MKRIQIKERLAKRQQQKDIYREHLSQSRLAINNNKGNYKYCSLIEPLYLKLEKNFHENVEMPDLKKRKEQLKKIREMKGKPLDHNEIVEHEQKYESAVKQRMAELEQKRRNQYADIEYDPSKYKTRINQRLLIEDMNRKQENEEKELLRKQLAEKKIVYGEFVNKMHKPVISLKKKVQMESLVEKSKHPIKESKKIPSSASYHDLYNVDGKHPWNVSPQNMTNSRISGISKQRFSTPKSRLVQHSKFSVRKHNQKKSKINKSLKHNSHSKLSIARDEINSDDQNNTDVLKTHSSTINVVKGPARKLIISKNGAPRPPRSMQGARYKPPVPQSKPRSKQNA